MKIFNYKGKLAIALLLLMTTINGMSQDSLSVSSKNFGENKVGQFLKSGDNQTAVTIVLCIILLGIFLYLFRLEKKVNAAIKNK
jgi:Na+-driven multidrug efflux pump